MHLGVSQQCRRSAPASSVGGAHGEQNWAGYTLPNIAVDSEDRTKKVGGTLQDVYCAAVKREEPCGHGADA